MYAAADASEQHNRTAQQDKCQGQQSLLPTVHHTRCNQARLCKLWPVSNSLHIRSVQNQIRLCHRPWSSVRHARASDLMHCHARQVTQQVDVTLSPGVPKIVHLAVEDSLWLQKSRPGIIPSWGVLVTSPFDPCGSGNASDLELHNSQICFLVMPPSLSSLMSLTVAGIVHGMRDNMH